MLVNGLGISSVLEDLCLLLRIFSGIHHRSTIDPSDNTFASSEKGVDSVIPGKKVIHTNLSNALENLK